ncbi:hypothetical protein M9H77_19872 [Catharanthus roseus]|uniref:Uncharacterized protein n=1 Tax=Catharanthus roseus TaxID=4058 RepID=A0ACC0BBJ1_CATRO|nr:hypothetical protein M9H77_19872 [Catharanthus roseus]
MSNYEFSFFCIILITSSIIHAEYSAELSPDYYDETCPAALPAVTKIVQQAIKKDPRMAASLLRLHFHDCFVNGCDGSNLLDDNGTFVGEKTASANLNSARGYEVIDEIKDAVDTICYGSVVSCADILALAARDSIVAVILSGAHTIGLARCSSFLARITNDKNINSVLRYMLRRDCPNVAAQSDNIAPLDQTSTLFDSRYYQELLQFKGLLHSDQELYKGNNGSSESTDALVKKYSISPKAFLYDFAVSMVKMGSINPLTGLDGEIRSNCRAINND